MIAAIGAGDGESEEEMVTFGLEFGDVAHRVAALREAVEASRDRGYPVWVGGHDPAVREVAAAHADGWNKWGGSVRTFRAQADGLRVAAARDPFTITWGGLVVLGATDDDAAAKARGSRRARARSSGGPSGSPTGCATTSTRAPSGSSWPPSTPADPENASMLGELVAPLLGTEP